MPETFSSVALNVGVPLALVFWYACRVRHPARPRWLAFLMALAVVAVVPAATLAGLYYAISVRDGSPFILVPVAVVFPLALRWIIRAWLRSPPRVRPTGPALSGPSPAEPESTGLAEPAGP